MIDQIINNYTNISEISDYYQNNILLEMVNYLLKESDIIYYMESTEESEESKSANKSEKPTNKILGWIKKAGATCVKVIKKIGKTISDKGKEIFNNHFKKVEKEKDSVQENEAINWVNSDEFVKMLGEKGIKDIDIKIIRTSVIGYLKTGEVVTNVTSAFVANIEKLTNTITNDSKISFGGDLSGFWKNMVQNLLNFKPASIPFDEYKQNTLNMLSKFKILNPLLKREEDNTRKEMESIDTDQENPDKKNTIFQNMKNRLSNLKSLSGWVDACKTKSENVIKAIEGTIEHFSKNKGKDTQPTKTDIENAQKQVNDEVDNFNNVTKKKVEEIQNASEIDKNEPLINTPQPEQKPEQQNQPTDVEQQVQPPPQPPEPPQPVQPTQPEQDTGTQIQQEPTQQKTQEPDIQQQSQAEPVQPPKPEQSTQTNTNMNAPNTRDVNQPINDTLGKNIKIDNEYHGYEDPIKGYGTIYVKGSYAYKKATDIDAMYEDAADWFTISPPLPGQDNPQLVSSDSKRSPVYGEKKTTNNGEEWIMIRPNPEFFQRMPLDSEQINRTSKSLNDTFKGLFVIRGETSQPLFGISAATYYPNNGKIYKGTLVFGGEEG